MKFQPAIRMSLILLTAFPLHSDTKIQEWKTGPFWIRIDNGSMDILHGASKLAEDPSFEFNFVRPDSVFIQNVRHDTLFRAG
jgi:hypothetical protein